MGFIVHIFYGGLLTAQNNKARGNSRYASGNNTKEVMWASKNMWILGLTILAFLTVHIIDYWVPLQITHGAQSTTIGGVEMHDTYALVKANLQNPLKAILYIIGSLGLALHLTHGFWSAFQTLGASNSIWRKRWTVIGTVFAWVINLGFIVIAVYFMLFS
ncbi:succinate dehydrogenase (or fumarate reductase) cytochrome b subunit, b558 family [Saccharicrinis fermentans DSM 9555 = JCM 21142]|uniref:Succinate dehydrogenase (Or fumarate reductase) cytochrome b subunit, b558 family n=1 Tax=Saccharicrinis fermentans DSM 9555 = JCM 21142 TaxID=869213 RepID=W7XWR8_9BACT|nr:succinate dehydrogenase (or fumarate reductase) cytochrome b subunit, b558 family [Saccharicrinis fermentans DSM 9555 = JCM 21142]